MGGWSNKTKLILISTSVEVVVEVEVELGKNCSIPSMRNIDNRGEKKETLKTIMKIVGKL